MSAEPEAGASANERLIAAARQDNEDLILEVIEDPTLDINFQDGLGNTALHWAAQLGSTDVLEYILSHENCDVDPINRLDKSTPLHLAAKIEDQEMRKYIVESLLDAGADTTIKDKDGDLALDYIPKEDLETRALFRKVQTQASISKDDIASDDDGEPGSGSGSGSDDENVPLRINCRSNRLSFHPISVCERSVITSIPREPRHSEVKPRFPEKTAKKPNESPSSHRSTLH
ncbi:ankyrin repeat-containing domain protein [Amylostereum chailletii]|nr:ankyrin repeat-containing domain protein [Amylostereum chailletii]